MPHFNFLIKFMEVSILSAFWMELLASFIFVYVLLMVKEPIPVGLTLIGLLYFTNKFPNGAFNPAALIAQYLNGKMATDMFVWFVIAQVVGAFGAFYFYKIMNGEEENI